MNNFTIYVPDKSSEPALLREISSAKIIKNKDSFIQSFRKSSESTISQNSRNYSSENGPSIFRMRFEVGFGKFLFEIKEEILALKGLFLYHKKRKL
jgi:hypothetical protein